MANTQGRGTTILTLGIIGIICCMPCGIAAWVMGSGDLKSIDAGMIPESERQLTHVGMILGMVSVALWAVGIVIQIIIFSLGGMGAMMGS
jgi:hypothetical protein